MSGVFSKCASTHTYTHTRTHSNARPLTRSPVSSPYSNARPLAPSLVSSFYSNARMLTVTPFSSVYSNVKTLTPSSMWSLYSNVRTLTPASEGTAERPAVRARTEGDVRPSRAKRSLFLNLHSQEIAFFEPTQPGGRFVLVSIASVDPSPRAVAGSPRQGPHA